LAIALSWCYGVVVNLPCELLFAAVVAVDRMAAKKFFLANKAQCYFFLKKQKFLLSLDLCPDFSTF
jgi:hypothetical protein